MNFSADLVVLSACQTGKVEVVGGDEILGLTRAFLVAGTKSILSTLWNIDDKITLELMDQFYRAYRANQEKGEAFQVAVSAIRQRYPDPRHWAAFQLTGALN
jgi:CHAT domain-containing protein